MYQSLLEEKRRRLRLSTMQKIVVGFFLLILVGAFLLWLPICNVDGYIPFIDALFTATSAVCVTGLMTVVPATQFTIIGKIILLILIQIGGLGVIACTISFFIIIGKKITFRERVAIQETYNLDTLSGMVSMIIWIIKLTFIAELIGAICFSFQFIPDYGLVKGVWYSIFHSISAFCNAGIDILGPNSFINYTTNPIVNLTTMGLIVSGGIGFIVWTDIGQNMKLVKRGKLSFRKGVHHLQLHSKIVISMTFFLILSGTLFYMIVEWNNPDTFGMLEPAEKVMASFFQSITTRTAGFATVDQGGLREESAFFTCIFMFIGGSPAGTAGGVKTTTIFMLIMTCVATMRNRNETEVFGRKIPRENIKSGISIIIVAFIALLVGVIAFNIAENVDFLDGLYEICSALGTVGLSRGATGEIGAAGKIIEIILMYLGRIGPITIALAFGYKKNSHTNYRELPTKRILVG